MVNSLPKSLPRVRPVAPGRKSCTILCAGILIFILAGGDCLAGHTQNIMLTGYWPPTNEILREFSTNSTQNPGGWKGQNWEGRGYDVYAFFPEFPGGTGSNPKGNGDFEVDYQDVGSWQPPANPTGDFWRITSQVHPVAIMSYGAGAGPFEIEYNARNLTSWSNDYLDPKQPTPVPPDGGQVFGYVRNSSLPVEAIAESVNSSGLGLKAWIDWDGDPGAFLCEYMAYHDGWYQSLHSDPCDQYYCVAAGFTHLANGTSVSTATAGVEAALRALINQLDSQLIQYTISGTVTFGGSPLAGVTMCGLPGNPVTNSSGVYSAQVGGGWSGTVTPLKTGYAFNPSQRTYNNVRANQSAQNYTTSSATAETIVSDAASSYSSGSGSTTLSWSHTIGSGNNRILVVGAVCEDSVPADQIISSVKFNGVNMTAVPGSTKSRGNSSSTLRADSYYMLNPPVGTYTVLITYNGTVSYRAGGAISLKNVKQQAPETVATNSISSATSISTNITVPNSGAWIVDVVGHSNSGAFTSSTSTERWDKNSGYHTGAGATKTVTSPGSNTMSWTYSGSSGTMVHSLAAFAPSETMTPSPPGKATGPSPADSATGVSITADLSWTAGSGATSLDVYFGTSSPGTFQGNQAGTTFDPGTLSNNTTYYWRIDEKNDGGTTTGDVWSFTTIPILTFSITGTAGSNGSISPSGTFFKDYGSSQLFTATPNTGYQVDTWSVDSSPVQTGGTTYTLSNITANHTVAVSFKQLTYTVTTSAGANGSVAPPIAVVVYNGSQLFTATSNTGYTVDKWQVDGGDVQTGGNTYTISNVTATHTVAVTFAPIEYTLTINKVGNGTVAKDPDQATYHYGEVVTLSATEDTGWTFAGFDPEAVVTMDSDKTVTATFTEDEYTLTMNKSGNGSVAIEPNQATYIYGTVVTVTANADAGWTFDSWSGDLGGSTNPTTITMTGEKTVTATFTQNEYTLTVDKVGNGTVAKDPDQATYHYGEVVTLSATEDTGWTFASFDPAAVITMDDNKTVTATFTQNQYTITVSADANGTIEPNGAIVKNYGQDQLFTAAPNTGYTVDKWSLDGSEVQTGGKTYTVSDITADHTLGVTFKLLEYVIAGYIVEPDGNTPVAEVVISTGDRNSVTDSNGYYQLWVNYGWSGTVTPEKEGYTFEPNSSIYTNITNDYYDVNYAATLSTFVISGYILESDNITPISDVNVSAENGGGPYTSRYGGFSYTTGSDGYYEVRVDCNWSGKVIAQKYAYVFEPNNISYTTVTADYSDQDYIGTLMTFSISGYVKNYRDVPINGVLVDANNGGGSDITDPNGCYDVWVDYNWCGTVTPSKTHYTFELPNMVYINVLEDRMNQDYDANNIYDLDCDGSIGFGDVGVISDNWLDDSGSNICDFDIDGDVDWLDFAIFADVWLEN